jgi:AAA domain/UvrD-like helicase C-terminal domain
MNLNSDQTKLIMELTKFYNSDRQYFVLSGQAGVGKTTCMRFFAESLQDAEPGIKICMGGPTNKSTAVLADSVGNSDITFKTIYSLLGLRMMANGEIKELKDSGQDSVGNYDLVIVDEASMVSSELIDYIKKKTALADTKVIFIGDKEQLPPVNEQVSPIWVQFKLDYELTEVMRHQNSILDFVQSIRGNTKPKFKSTGDQVFVHEDETPFISEIERLAKAGDFHAGKAKAIAWRNVTVDFLNKFIRQTNDATNSEDTFVPGDRIVFKQPLVIEEKLLASTDEEGTVVDVKVAHHNKYPMLKAWQVKIKLDWTGSHVTAYVVHESSQKNLDMMLDEFKTKKRWDLFWKLKEAFHDIAYGYALTAHRSQGSTFDRVFVDGGDILLNRNIEERTKCLYVACSRASKELHVFP